MGDLARHVAKVARLRYPESAVPAELRATILQMGQVAERIVEKAGSVIAARDVEAAHQIERDDDAMDDLHRELFARVTDGSWPHGTEAAVDITLLGRYYERFADHARQRRPTGSSGWSPASSTRPASRATRTSRTAPTPCADPGER